MVVRASYTVPIRLSYDPETEWTPPTPRKRPRRVSEEIRELMTQKKYSIIVESTTVRTLI